MTTIKVIHVHLIYKKQDYYFGSLSAIFTQLSEQQIGIRKSTLLHTGLKEGMMLSTHVATIRCGCLVRGGNRK